MRRLIALLTLTLLPNRLRHPRDRPLPHTGRESPHRHANPPLFHSE
jgi:hypothetical protein